MGKNLTKLLVLLLAAVLVLGLTACGKDETADVTGKYNCIAVATDGTTFTAPESEDAYVELKKGGKGEISDELSFELTWKLDGESFSGSYKIFGVDAPVTGTLKEGILEISDDGVVTRYLKEGLETPDWAKNLEAAPNDEGRLAGHYMLYAMSIGGEYFDYAALVEMDEMDDSYLQIDYDETKGYTGELCFDGEDPDTFILDDLMGNLTFSDGTQMMYYESEEGVIGVMFEELNATIFYTLPSTDRGTAGTDKLAAETDPLLNWWNGDWYGWWHMYGCKGTYEDIELKYWDCEAHIEIGSDYTGTMELWDDEMYQVVGVIGLVDVSLSDSGTGEHGTLMSEGGWFMEMKPEHADWIIDPALSDYENMITITGDYDDGNGNSYYFEVMLRPWGALWEDVDEENRPWSYEDWYKPMIEDGVTKMSVRFGDPDPSVYEGLESAQNEDAAGSENGISSAEYGKSNAAATGDMDLEKLKSCYETLKNAEDRYDYLYEDVRDLMGCDGCAYDIDGEWNAYCWQNGNVIVTVTFKVLDDGNEECRSIVISGI